MATYAELLQAAGNSDLLARIRVACIVSAEQIRTEAGATANHAQRMVWAKAVFENPEREALRMLWAVLAQNRSATLSQIINATDAAVQTAVDAAVNVFAV